MRATCPVHLIPPPWSDHPNSVLRRVQIMEFILQFSPASCRFIHIKNRNIASVLFLTASAHNSVSCAHFLRATVTLGLASQHLLYSSASFYLLSLVVLCFSLLVLSVTVHLLTQTPFGDDQS
jgi:hypothetical protein